LTGKKNERIGNQIVNTCLLPIIPPRSSAYSRGTGVALFFLLEVTEAQLLHGDKAALCCLLLGGCSCPMRWSKRLCSFFTSARNTESL